MALDDMKSRFVTRLEASKSSTSRALLTAYDAVADSNIEAAYSIMRRLADEDVAEAQHFVGWCFQQGAGVEQNNEDALRWWLKAATFGFGESQSAVATCYENGQGAERDLKQAYVFHRLAERSGITGSGMEAARIWHLLLPSEQIEVDRRLG